MKPQEGVVLHKGDQEVGGVVPYPYSISTVPLNSSRPKQTHKGTRTGYCRTAVKSDNPGNSSSTSVSHGDSMQRVTQLCSNRAKWGMLQRKGPATCHSVCSGILFL